MTGTAAVQGGQGSDISAVPAWREGASPVKVSVWSISSGPNSHGLGKRPFWTQWKPARPGESGKR